MNQHRFDDLLDLENELRDQLAEGVIAYEDYEDLAPLWRERLDRRE